MIKAPSFSSSLKIRSDSSLYPHMRQKTVLDPTHRLIVLVFLGQDYLSVTQQIWKLANASQMHVQLLGICKSAGEESSLRMQLITMSAILENSMVLAEAKVEVASKWLEVVKSNVQAGDMLICLTEQRVRPLQRPLTRILEANLNVPFYILPSMDSQNYRGNLFSQIAAWSGSTAIIIGFGSAGKDYSVSFRRVPKSSIHSLDNPRTSAHLDLELADRLI